MIVDAADNDDSGIGSVEDMEGCWVGVVEEEMDDEAGVISTSSASRHHLRRRVYLPQPSWRLPFRHYVVVSYNYSEKDNKMAV